MRIGVATSGLWQLRDAIELITGGTCRRLGLLGLNLDAVAGWGHKPTAARARLLAKRRGIPYLAFEDGFLRSIHPGNDEKPLSLILDRTGIYYDATGPSDLEALVRRRADLGLDTRPVCEVMELLQEKRLSKYNNSTLDDLTSLQLLSSDRQDRVLVVDQTAGDASISGAMASDETFGVMLSTAVTENPAAEILIRVHPETMLGRKAGHFTREILERFGERSPAVARALKENRLRLTPEPVNPWALLEGCSKLYCVSSQLGFEGLMAGCEVNCFGMPFYGGWGLTKDCLVAAPSRRRPTGLEALVAAVYLDYCHYIDHEGGRLFRLEEATDELLRRRIAGTAH